MESIPNPMQLGWRVPIPWRLLGDEAVAQGAGEGSEGAFAVLYQRYHQATYRYCWALLRDEQDAQDALQSTFSKVHVGLQRGRRDAPLRPWLFRIAHNESISLIRRRHQTRELDGELPSTADSQYEILAQRQRLRTLLDDLHELPERQRGPLVMRELSGLPHEEIGAALGISVGAAKQAVLEARRSLLEFAEGREMPCAEIQQIVSDGDRRTLRARRVRAHLRECAACATFAKAIPTRRTELQAAVPLIPVAASGLVWSKIGGTGSLPSGLGSSLAVGGKGIGAVVSSKLLAGTAAIAVAVAGGAALVHRATAPATPTAARTMPHVGLNARTRSPTTAASAGPTAAQVQAQGASRTDAARALHAGRASAAAAAAHHARATAIAPVSATSAASTVNRGRSSAAQVGGRGGGNVNRPAASRGARTGATNASRKASGAPLAAGKPTRRLSEGSSSSHHHSTGGSGLSHTGSSHTGTSHTGSSHTGSSSPGGVSGSVNRSTGAGSVPSTTVTGRSHVSAH